MDRKTYFNGIYDHFWLRQTYKYGYTEYEKYFVREILKAHPKTVFSCGIGNAWPIESELYNHNIHIEGCDLSEKSVKQAQIRLECTEDIFVGNIMDRNCNKKYDVIFCARASWYIPNFFKHVDAMLDMCKDEGMVMFDIMALESIYAIKEILFNHYLKLVGIIDNYAPKTLFYSVVKMKKHIEKQGYKVKIVPANKITEENNIFYPQKYFFIIRRR